jgi:hypothetical protein
VNDSAIYLYCFARSDLLKSLQEKGIDGVNPPTVHFSGKVAAVLDRVPMEEFTGTGAEARLRDLEWVAPRAFWHQKVIEEAAAKSPVFPVGFGTLFLSLESLDRFIQKKVVTISDFLREMSGKEEWAVKAFHHPEKARQRVLHSVLHPRKQSTSPGAQYLLEKRAHASVDEELDRRNSEMLSKVLDRLLPLSEDVRERDLLPGDRTEAGEEMVANWAFLVSRNSRSSFLNSIVRINIENADEDLFLRSSGPWPPYSFTPPLDMESGA